MVDTDGTEWSAGDLLSQCNRVAHGLRALGLRPGDTVAAILPNGVLPATVYLAALQIGLYYVPINYRLSPPEIAYILTDSEAKAFITHERFADVVVPAAATRPDSPPRPASRSARSRASDPSRISSPVNRTRFPTIGWRARRCTTRAAPPADPRA